MHPAGINRAIRGCAPGRPCHDCHDAGPGKPKLNGHVSRLLVEVISEGPHCVPCEYCIAAVRHVAAEFHGRLEIKVVETKRQEGARRFLELQRSHGGKLEIPSVLLDGHLAFAGIPGPDELRQALDNALASGGGG